MTKAADFRLLRDPSAFPLLAKGEQLPGMHLAGCDDLAFYAALNPQSAAQTIAISGTDWHLYGDTRWPNASTWIEFTPSPAGYPGSAGVLVMRADVPSFEPDPLEWIATNLPLTVIFREHGTDDAISERLQMLRSQANSTEQIPGPSEKEPRHVQCYCIYREIAGAIRVIAIYTDVLNKNGIPLPLFRMASVQPHDVPVSRFCIHALFRLNHARLTGDLKFRVVEQLPSADPFTRPADALPARWIKFHPTRQLKIRTTVNSIPTPDDTWNGILSQKAAEQVVAMRMSEMASEQLAISREARSRHSHHEDINTTLTTFNHRINGGAIFVIPDRLVEEFDNTDCDEILVSDLTLPFNNVYVSFRPPQPLFLGEDAEVEGCYIAKQGDEYLFVLTSRRNAVDYQNSPSITCLDPTFSIHLPAPDVSLENPTAKDIGLTINEAVERGIQRFLEENAPPTDNFTQTIEGPGGLPSTIIDLRAQTRKRRIETFQSQEPVFRACLNIIVNAACFISFCPDEIEEEWEGNPPEWIDSALKDMSEGRRSRDRRRHALQTLAQGDYVRIKICGRSLFQGLPAPTADGSGTGKSPRTHWRRGHWRRQRFGVGLSMVKPKRIRPTIVNKGHGEPVSARIYDVEDSAGKTSDNSN